MQLYRGDKSLPLARRWPLGRRAAVAGPHPNLAGAAIGRGLPCAGAQDSLGGAGQAEEGTQAAPGQAEPTAGEQAALQDSVAPRGPRFFPRLLLLLLAFLRVRCRRRRLPLLLEVSLMGV